MTTTQTIGSIVIGVDDSDGSPAAISWAAAAARSHRWPVTLAYAYPDLAFPGISGFTPPQVDLRKEAEQVVDRAEAHLRSAGFLEQPRRVVQPAVPATLLHELGREAHVVVVGRRGTGRFRDLLLGSTAYGVAQHGDAPVVIVPEHWDRATSDGKPVVVGLDEESGDAAIDFAFDFASRTEARLVALHVFAPTVSTTPVGFGGYAPALEGWTAARKDALDERRRQLAEQLAGWQEKYPEVEVTANVVTGYPAGVLLDESSEAALLVVGGRDHGLLASTILGSVARNVMHHATCPLAIVHTSR